MATSRFSTNDSNALGPVFQGGVPTVTLINGNGAYTNRPALEQDAMYPMVNVLNPDRYLPWKTSNAPPAGNDAIKLDVDLGADRTIKVISLHGIRCGTVAEGLFPAPFFVHAAYRTATQGYDGGGTFTDFKSGVGAAFGGYRDTVIEDATARTFRYLRLMWSNANASFALGRLFVGVTPPADAGRLYWPNSSDDVTLPALVSDNGAAGPLVTFIGDTRREFKINLSSIDAATLAALVPLRHTRQPFVYYRHDGTVYECILVGLSSSVAHLFGAPDTYSVTLHVLALG